MESTLIYFFTCHVFFWCKNKTWKVGKSEIWSSVCFCCQGPALSLPCRHLASSSEAQLASLAAIGLLRELDQRFYFILFLWSYYFCRSCAEGLISLTYLDSWFPILVNLEPRLAFTSVNFTADIMLSMLRLAMGINALEQTGHWSMQSCSLLPWIPYVSCFGC